MRNTICLAGSAMLAPQSSNGRATTAEQRARFWVGTSGFSYPGWVGRLYPPGTRASQMLTFYAATFPMVELNFSFYRMPSAGGFDSMVRRTPPGFQFVVKMHRDVTHAGDRSALGRFLDALEPLRCENRLAGILGQFPQRFHRTQMAWNYLWQLADDLAGYETFVEFRHRSWYSVRLPAQMRALGFHIVSVDVPDIPALFPRRLMVTTGQRAYIRFHSRSKNNWYADGKDRYDYLFSDAELKQWLRELERLQVGLERVLMVFNNCRKAQAAENALRVRRLLEERFGPGTVADNETAASAQLPLLRQAHAL